MVLWAAELIRLPRVGFRVAESSQPPSISALSDDRASKSGAEFTDVAATLVLLVTYIMVLFKMANVTLEPPDARRVGLVSRLATTLGCGAVACLLRQ